MKLGDLQTFPSLQNTDYGDDISALILQVEETACKG